jgi:hypothetical protein
VLRHDESDDVQRRVLMARETDFERTERQRSELRAIDKKLLDLEASLGLALAMEKAHEGNFFPLGIDGEDVSPEEYFADEHDGERRRVREVYFGVADVERRKELIELQCQLEQQVERHRRDDLLRAEAKLVESRLAARQLPWELASAIAVGSVAFGHYFQGLTGAIAGAVGGFFLAQGFVARRKAHLLAELEQAELELVDLQKARRIAELKPAYFNELEALSGEEDREFGRQDARWKVAEHERQEKLK